MVVEWSIISALRKHKLSSVAYDVVDFGLSIYFFSVLFFYRGFLIYFYLLYDVKKKKTCEILIKKLFSQPAL